MALKKENDAISKKRLESINEELSHLEIEAKQLSEKWQKEKQQLLHFKELKKTLDQNRFELEKAFNEGNYKLASELKYSKIPSLEKEIREYQNRSKENHLLSEAVDEEDIASVVAKWTNIPISKLMQGEKDKILHLKETLENV